VLKRHAQALHELTKQECRELGELQGKSARVLFRVLDCEKEYSMCLAEAEGFNHVHVHLVAKPRGLPAELRGVRIFALLKPGEDTVPPQAVARFCEELREEFVKMEDAR
jgi:diadenosine tetraphosphate (Ap4A) HIT family hydrolase